MFLLRNVGILFVNGKRRGLRVRGRALVNNPKRKKRRHYQPRWLLKHIKPAGYKRPKGAKRRHYIPPHLRPKAAPGRTPAYRRALRKAASLAGRGAKHAYARAKHYGARGVSAYRKAKARRSAARAKTVKQLGGLTAEYGPMHRNPGRKANRSKKMAKGSKSRSRAMKRIWRARRKAGKMGAIGRTKRVRRRRARKASAPKRRRRARKAHTTRRRRRKARKVSTRRRKRAARKGWAKRRYGTAAFDYEAGLYGGTRKLKKNPGRRRRRRRARRAHAAPRRRRRRARARRRSGGRRRARRGGYRRYAKRHYRRNPGNMFVDLLKRAIPVVASFYGTRAIVARVAPMLPGVSSLGSFAGPVVGGLAVLGANYATRKFSMLAKHRQEIMLGVGFSLVDSLFQAFAPASVKAMIGMSDYVQMGDYIAVGATPIDDNMTLSDYIAVGGDGVQEELGLEEELGSVQEELGTVDIGGVMGGGRSLLAPVPSQSFLKPIPDRSFTKVIPAAGTNYDNASQLYGGIFGGRFGN